MRVCVCLRIILRGYIDLQERGTCVYFGCVRESKRATDVLLLVRVTPVPVRKGIL